MLGRFHIKRTAWLGHVSFKQNCSELQEAREKFGSGTVSFIHNIALIWYMKKDNPLARAARKYLSKDWLSVKEGKQEGRGSVTWKWPDLGMTKKPCD